MDDGTRLEVRAFDYSRTSVLVVAVCASMATEALADGLKCRARAAAELTAKHSTMTRGALLTVCKQLLRCRQALAGQGRSLLEHCC